MSIRVLRPRWMRWSGICIGYVGMIAPFLDEVLGLQFGNANVILPGQCFRDSSDQLIVSYSMTPAFG